MKASERVHRGFWRIGLAGFAASTVIALLLVGYGIYEALTLTSVRVDHGGRYIVVELPLSHSKITQALEQMKGLAGWNAADEAFTPIGPAARSPKSESAEPIDAQARRVMTLAEAEVSSFRWQPLFVPWMPLSVGIAWFAAWLLASWIIRGFLA